MRGVGVGGGVGFAPGARAHFPDDPVARALCETVDMELQRALLADASAAVAAADPVSG